MGKWNKAENFFVNRESEKVEAMALKGIIWIISIMTITRAINARSTGNVSKFRTKKSFVWIHRGSNRFCVLLVVVWSKIKSKKESRCVYLPNDLVKNIKLNWVVLGFNRLMIDHEKAINQCWLTLRASLSIVMSFVPGDNFVSQLISSFCPWHDHKSKPSIVPSGAARQVKC